MEGIIKVNKNVFRKINLAFLLSVKNLNAHEHFTRLNRFLTQINQIKVIISM